MSGSFLAILVLALIVVIFWRMALQILVAVVLALLVYSMSQVVAQAQRSARADPPASVEQRPCSSHLPVLTDPAAGEPLSAETPG